MGTRPQALRPLVIGICGGTGSGKTTITNGIIRALSEDNVLVLEQDHYYKDLPHLPIEERARQNFDHPDSMDTPLLAEHVRRLRKGGGIARPVYDFIQYRRLEETVRLEPRRALIVEGILIFENGELRDLMDIKIFVDTDADLRFIRRLVRDIRERGRTVESVIAQYQQTVRPMHLEFVEPSKRYADVIIPEGGHNEVGIDLVIQKIRSLIPR
ncbi:MAG TPA: uridine kinase [Candidatus Acidoferrales bacterium]|jgi:uridine kinase|nr:uridine kinase [Candidatus Acidoferrales bacterium]